MILNKLVLITDSYYKKHKILKAIYDFSATCPSHWYIGSCGLSIKTFQDKFNFKVTKELTDSLLLSEYIIKDEHTFTHDPTYCITLSGRQAYLEKYFLKQSWFYSRNLWASSIAIIISIIALFKK